jgi:DNA-binding NarL/FixJ family response regulator
MVMEAASNHGKSMSITVSIVEDDHATRDSLEALLKETPGLECKSTYATGEEALTGIPQEKPDVVLADIRLPGISGIECVARLKMRMPKLQVLMLTTYEERELIFNSLRAGASGYILKNAPRTELVHAVEQVHAGGAPMSMQIARKVVSHFQAIPDNGSDVEKLTQREHQILSLLAKGFLYKEIADQLGISMGTVKVHVHTIYEKLHVQSRTQATLKFLGKE